MEKSVSTISNIQVPSEQIFKVHYLDSSKTENKIIVFSNSNGPVNLNEMFSEEDIVNIELNNIEVVFSSQQIYKDDTIRTIKKKIITEIGKNVVSYPELYLFSKIKSDLTLFQIYNYVTHDDKIPLNSVMLGQLLQNLGVNDAIIIDKIPVQDVYTYNNLTTFLSFLENEQEMWLPIGPKFIDNKIELLFQANPYNIINADNNPFQHTSSNPLISFENNVLLSYGDLINNTIYATSASDVIEYGKTIQLDDEYIIPLYFPLLGKQDIFTGSDIIQKKQLLLAENDKLYDKSFEKIEENLQTLYQIYNNGSRDDIKYSQNGVQNIDFTIHPSSKVKLPLDVLFKTMHSTKNIPFIKYNPGARFEKMYRVYTEDITQTGQQIPFLSKGEIMNYSKNIGKSLQISLVVRGNMQGKEFDVIININQNGDINVMCDFYSNELEIPRSIVVFSLPTIPELEIYIDGAVNDTINTLNKYLHGLGYKLQPFINLRHKNIEIVNINYKIWSPLTNDIIFKDVSPCLTSMFEIQELEQNDLQMNFKRVNNYTQMNAINRMITDVYQRSNSEKEVINSLVLNYNYTEQGALMEFTKYLNNFTRINGQYVNKNIDIVENPGFSVNMGKLQAGLILYIEVTRITNIRYIELLSIYFDSFLRVSQKIGITGVSKPKINQLCSGKYDTVKEPTIENIIIPSNKSISPISQDDVLLDKEDDDDDDDDDDAFLYMDDDEDEDEDEDDDEDDEEDYIDGGAKKSQVKKSQIKIEPRKYNFNKLRLLEPEIILTKGMGHYKAYSRGCPANLMRQPVILTDDEKTQIDKENRNGYGYALKYGADKENPHWFICPRYWCTETNQPLTKSQVDSGKCPGKIYEFTENRFHVDKDGNYVHHRPGFLPDETHPKYGVPCCFSKPWDSTQLKERRTKWGITENSIDVPKGSNWEDVIDGKAADITGEIEVIPEKEDKYINPAKAIADALTTIRYFSKLSFFENPGMWVFLPRSVQLFLDIEYQSMISSDNPQKLKENQRAYLLYTVERKYHQSFIGCIARTYADINEYNTKELSVPTISEMRNIIADSITLDMFLQYHNGSLASTFQPKNRRANDDFLNKHYNSVFYKSLDDNIPAQMDFYEHTVASFAKFLEYIRDDDSWIDYVYLWDIVTSPNPNLFPNGLNLVILSVTDNDVTDNVELICPSNSYSSKIHDKNKNTLILVEQDHYYAIVSVYDNTDGNKSVKRISTFGNNEKLPELRKTLKKIQNTTNKYCKPLPSMPKEYKYKQNIVADKVYDILQKHKYMIDYQVSNYRNKIIGFIVRVSDVNTNSVFIPCLPSSVLQDIPIQYMDNIQWTDYVTTRDMLFQIQENTKNELLCKPLLKVVEDGLIVGILTETNQVLQINPPINNDIDDGIDIIKVKGYANNGYSDADKTIQTTSSEDSQRKEVVRNIRLETQFYSSFKTTIRILLNDPLYSTLKEKLIGILNDNRFLYRIKLQKLEILLKYLLRNTVSFHDIEEDVLKNMDEVSICTDDNTDKPYCIVKNNNQRLIIPSTNLMSGIDNEKLYFGRIADELLRYKRVKLFMLEPKKYLNIGTVDYNVNKNEVILLQSVLTDEYWENLEPFYTNAYIRNLNVDNAEPAITQKYSSEISISQQEDHDEVEDGKPRFGQCIKEELNEVIGNNQSKWKQAFPEDSKETIYQCSHICSYYLIQMIYQTYYDKQITVNELRTKLIQLYSKYVDSHKSKIYDILRKQNGKSVMINKVIKNKLTIEDLIMSEDYYLTTLDMWMLASELKLPIMLFSQSPLENLNLKIDWVLFGGDPSKDRFFFIRSPATSKQCPEYRMVTPQRPLYELTGFGDLLENPENYIDNNMDFESYLNQVSLVLD